MGPQTVNVLAKAVNPGQVIGVATTAPYQTFGEDIKEYLDKLGRADLKAYPVALNGRVPVNVSSLSETISAGDYLALSLEPGKAQKATASGPVVGKALENWSNESGKRSILMFVQYGWYEEGTAVNGLGNFTVANENPQTPESTFTVRNSLGEKITKVTALAESVIGNLHAGLVNTRELTTDKLTIAGRNLRDYILEVVSTSQLNLSTSNQIKTDLISPLASNSAITVNGPLIIKNQAPQPSEFSPPLLIVEGSASISGQLTTRELNVLGNATISGTLEADKLLGEISSSQITDLEGVINTSVSSASTSLREQILAQVQSLLTPTPTAASSSSTTTGQTDLNALINATPTTPPPLDLSGLDASTSALLNNQPQITTLEQLVVTSSLSVLGPSSLSDTTIAGSLLIDGNLSLAYSGINSLSGPLYFNSLNLSGIDFLAGKVTIDQSGNMVIAGNLDIEGTLTAATIRTQDIQLSQNKSAGSSLIPARARSVTITSPTASPTSKIIITPTVLTDKILAVTDKQNGQFTVQIRTPENLDITFDWLIVNIN